MPHLVRTSLEQHRDVENEPAIVVYHGVTIDQTAMISVRYNNELAFDIHRHRPDALRPSRGQVASARVAMA
jgi:hypothetical protein